MSRAVPARVWPLVAVLLCAAGCESAVAPGAACAHASDCAAPLVCTLGRCRSECTATRDCPIGAECLLTAPGVGACALPTRDVCEPMTSPCNDGLVCTGTTCRQSCASLGCAEGSTCTRVAGLEVCVADDVDAGFPPNRCPAGMASIPAGRFMMGSDAGESDELPIREVTLSAYCIDVTEVTTSAYALCVASGPCAQAATTSNCNASAPGNDEHPINCVLWRDADEYCRWTGRRLPTEAEWERAARDDDQRAYPWGEVPPSATLLNACGTECPASEAGGFSYADEFPLTAPVGSFPDGASPFGVLDLAGNVWEWTADFYGPYTEGPATDPTGPLEGPARVQRGGSWFDAQPGGVRASRRNPHDPLEYFGDVGFRCAADPPP